jgi:hypothetical protein
VEILETGANNVYIVKDEAGTRAAAAGDPPVILEIDPERRLMRVHLLEGLV